MAKFFLSLFLLFSLASTTNAQSILTPDAFLGYKLGSKFTVHSRIVNYFEAVAASNQDQLKLKNTERLMKVDLC